MRNEIINLGKAVGIKLKVKSFKEAFDIIRYEVTHKENIWLGVYWHFTGKASNGNNYPTESILPKVEKDLNRLRLRSA